MPSKGINFYRDFKKFFSSGIFYIILGIVFLFVSSHQIGQADSHPSFIFLLAILGVAIVLYGTGTQAVGSGNTGRIKVMIAGGAGVLAIILGFGVVHFNEQIQKVFSYTKYYAVIELETDNPNADLDDFIIRAEMPNSQPLHLWKRNQIVEILVPVHNIDRETTLKVFVRKRSTGKVSPPIFNQNYVIKWSANSFESHRPGVELPFAGRIQPYGGIEEDVRFSIKDQLIVTSAEEVVETDERQPILVRPQ